MMGPMSGSDDEPPGAGDDDRDVDTDDIDLEDLEDAEESPGWPLRRVGRPRYRVALKRRRR